MGYFFAFLGNMPAFIKNIFYSIFKSLHPCPKGRGFLFFIKIKMNNYLIENFYIDNNTNKNKFLLQYL
jgi:hypothetical protein